MRCIMMYVSFKTLPFSLTFLVLQFRDALGELVFGSVLNFVLILHSETPLQPGRSYRNLQTIDPFYASRKSISPPLCPRPPFCFCPKIRPELDERNKSVSANRHLIIILPNSVDLAVIFRPGIISHPNHEMSPPEHHLSQRVLEFLIAHQDWFMLDIPPPPPLSRPGSPGGAGSGIDDIMVVPSSDEEYSQVGGGWRLVGKDNRKVSRRQTAIQHGGGLTRLSP
jgi:hypothetical protein